MLSPWLLGQAATSTYHPEIHRWHDAVWGVITTFLFTASMLTLLWKVYIGIIGLAFLYLGIAAVTIPTHPGSWGTIAGATLFEMRHSSQRTPAFAGNPTLTHA